MYRLSMGVQIFLRELISNASDALDKIRFLSLLDKSALSATEELSIKIKADKDGRMLHVTDTGIGTVCGDEGVEEVLCVGMRGWKRYCVGMRGWKRYCVWG